MQASASQRSRLAKGVAERAAWPKPQLLTSMECRHAFSQINFLTAIFTERIFGHFRATVGPELDFGHFRRWPELNPM